MAVTTSNWRARYLHANPKLWGRPHERLWIAEIRRPESDVPTISYPCEFPFDIWVVELWSWSKSIPWCRLFVFCWIVQRTTKLSWICTFRSKPKDVNLSLVFSGSSRHQVLCSIRLFNGYAISIIVKYSGIRNVFVPDSCTTEIFFGLLCSTLVLVLNFHPRRVML